MQTVLELQDSKCCWCSNETSTVRDCISSNRTVSSPVITGLLTVLLEYIDLFSRAQPTAPSSAATI